MNDFRPYLIAVAVGVLVGAIYGLLNVRSPAPPVIALVGLLGILLGEQIPPLAKRLFAHGVLDQASLQGCQSHILGPLPTRDDARPEQMAMRD